MNSPIDHSEESIRRPKQVPVSYEEISSTESVTKKNIEETKPLREGDTGLRHPVQIAQTIETVSEKDREYKEDTSQKQSEEQSKVSPKLFLVINSGLLLLLLAILALFGLYIYAQSLSIFKILLDLPPISQTIGFVCLAFLVFIVLYAIIIFCISYFRLHKNQQVTLRNLEERSNWQKISQDAPALKKILQNYLTNYDVRSISSQKNLQKVGISQDEFDTLARHKSLLLDDSRYIDSCKWLQEFQDDFQSLLDKTAQKRIKHYSLMVGTKTAIAPNGLIDTLIILYNNFAMLKDLCLIYNLRTSSIGTFYLIVRSIFQAYLGGELGDLTEKISEEIAQGTTSVLGQMGKFLLPKLAEGSANALLIYRMGVAAMKLLKPVIKKG